MRNPPRDIAAEMRERGWAVAVHNDYRLNGVAHTFWLWTHAESGRFVKGEGHTDAEALEQCLDGVARLRMECASPDAWIAPDQRRLLQEGDAHTATLHRVPPDEHYEPVCFGTHGTPMDEQRDTARPPRGSGRAVAGQVAVDCVIAVGRDGQMASITFPEWGDGLPDPEEFARRYPTTTGHAARLVFDPGAHAEDGSTDPDTAQDGS